MYAEGDLDQPYQENASAVFLKTILPTIVTKMRLQQDQMLPMTLDMGLLRHVFQSQLRRFYKTKKLTRGLQPTGKSNEDLDEDFKEEVLSEDQEDEEDEDFVERSNADADEVAMFTRDKLGELADSVSRKNEPHIRKIESQKCGDDEEKKGESHFKSVLKELEESVSSEDEDDDFTKRGDDTQAD